MTIDAKKIIPKLSVPLEDTEWKKLKNVNWGTLIKETYGDIIDWFTEYAWHLLQSKTTENMWRELLFKKDLWHITTSVAQ